MNSQEYLSDDSSITDDQYDSAVGLVYPEDPAIILRTTVRKDRFSSPENESFFSRLIRSLFVTD